MNVIWSGWLAVLLAAVVPTQAFLGKIALLGSLTSSVGGQGGGGAGGLTGPSRPVVATSNAAYGYDYGYGRQYYGGDQVVKIIKVVVPSEQLYPANSYASGYSSGWTPIPAQAPVSVQRSTSYVTTQALPSPVPVQPFVTSRPGPIPVQYSASQPLQVSVQSAPIVPTQAVSVPSQSVAVSQAVPVAQPVPIPQPLPAPRPVPVSQPLPLPQSVFVQQPQSQQFVKTIKLIIDREDGNQAGFRTYGPPPQDNYLGASWTQNDAAWNNGGGIYKDASFLEKVGC